MNFGFDAGESVLLVPLAALAAFKPADSMGKGPFFAENSAFWGFLVRILAYPDQLSSPADQIQKNSLEKKLSSACSSGNKESPVALGLENFKINLVNIPSDSSPKTQAFSTPNRRFFLIFR